MKVFQFAVAAALLVAPVTSDGAIIGVIPGDGADAVVRGPSGGGQDGINGLDVVTQLGATLRLGSQGGAATNANRGRVPVFVFQLPDLGAIADPFTTASLTFTQTFMHLTPSTDTTRNADLHGLARRDSTPEVLKEDYYLGNAADPTDATQLQVDIITPLTPEGAITTNATGSANLASFLNTQYASGAGIGEYVYLRLNVDGGVNGGAQGYDVYTANADDEAVRPFISFEAIPEPSSVALLAVGGLALTCRRRRR